MFAHVFFLFLVFDSFIRSQFCSVFTSRSFFVFMFSFIGGVLEVGVVRLFFFAVFCLFFFFFFFFFFVVVVFCAKMQCFFCFFFVLICCFCVCLRGEKNVSGTR
eukprot:Rhum_TRINITY_DN7855_c0_g1::Rhum_TRINITY_DN7855_c0_g1_i3::g.24885::m.24885